MEKQLWIKVNNIVDNALNLKDEERAKYIEKECGGDRQLRHEVREFLESIEQSEKTGFLEDKEAYLKDLPFDNNTSIQEASSSLVGKTIGNYKILELIGHGGMGSVFLTERVDDAYTEKVALKLVRQGMDTPANIARFRRERNILAKLNHPNIAHLLDGGVTEDGLPYLVMEHVDGVPLLEYCNKHNLSIKQRLELFESTCKAVAYAHKNAIIHRDLKPSNIFVTTEGTVKVLDFGIAKLIEENQDDDLLIQTHTSARILTLGYAAPEQFEDFGVTTSTDCYTLGILLYELLASTRPFDLGEKTLSGIEKTICNQTPAKPSKKFGALPQQEKVEIAHGRNLSPTDLERKLNGDLDAIAIKALRTETDARYDSVEQMLLDLNRYKQSRPLIAQSDTVRYRVTKFLNRNSRAVVAACLLIIMTVSFAMYHVNRITEERNRAEMEAQKAQTVQSFLIDIFRASNPRSSNFEGVQLSASQLLTNGINAIDQNLEDQPNVNIEVLLAIGEAQKNIDAYVQAERTYDQALAISSKTNEPLKNEIRTYVKLGWLHTDRRKSQEQAHEYALKAHDMLDRVDDPTPTLEASVYGILGRVTSVLDEYTLGNSYFEKADSIYISADLENSYEYIKMLTGYGRALLYVSDFEKSKEILEKSNRLHREKYDRPTLTIAENFKFLGWTNRELGDFEKSNEYFLKSIELKKELNGDRTVQMALPMYHLAHNYMLSGEFERSEELAQNVLSIYREELEPDNQYVHQAMNYLAIAKLHQNKFEEAEKLLTAIVEENEIEDYLRYVETQFAKVYQKTGRFDQAISLLKNALNFNESKFGYESRDVAFDMLNLATVYREMGNHEQAEEYYKQAESVLEKVVPEGHYRLAELNFKYAKLELETGQEQEALSRFKKAHEIYKDCFGEDNPRTADARAYVDKIDET